MTFTVGRIAKLPIVFSMPHQDYSMEVSQTELQAQVGQNIQQIGEPVFYIIDLSQTKLSLNDIIAGSNTGARSSASVWKNPYIREIVFVSTDVAVKMAVKGMNSEAFGYLDAKVFDTRDDAVVYIQDKI